jgi:hypothetical protein
MNQNQIKFNQQFCQHYFSDTSSRFSTCVHGCGLELGEVIQKMNDETESNSFRRNNHENRFR